MKKGFTLVELLVVIAIIAALAGFAISNLGSATKAVKNVEIKSAVKTINTQYAITRVETGYAEIDTKNGIFVNDTDKIKSYTSQMIKDTYGSILTINIPAHSAFTFNVREVDDYYTIVGRHYPISIGDTEWQIRRFNIEGGETSNDTGVVKAISITSSNLDSMTSYYASKKSITPEGWVEITQ